MLSRSTLLAMLRPLRGIVLFLYRSKVALGYYRDPLKELLLWLFQSRETTNFTYELTPINRRYLAALIAHVLGKSYEEIFCYMAELEADTDLRSHIRTATEVLHEETADPEARYGRRMGWYAMTRAIKPRVVVETGVDKGLGSCVLTAALARNTEEGFPGWYYGTDINPKAGYLLTGRYKQFGEILYGDSVTSLRGLDRFVDLFINDSDHSADYEHAEYETVASKLTAGAILLGDNSHCTDQLLAFALATGRQFVFFQERPDRHWYPGGGIGIAFSGAERSMTG
jgi:hypothetical protein